MRLLPKWRTVRTPQAANADGDFVQPAPDGSDAAWFFGFETEYAESSWLRSGSGRLGGHLLTASGCALKNLAPSASWSPDARYLALTRMNADMPSSWEVLLLDVEQRTLRTWPYSPATGRSLNSSTARAWKCVRSRAITKRVIPPTKGEWLHSS